jgi:predicted MPP superfamily phosphohydrolase
VYWRVGIFVKKTLKRKLILLGIFIILLGVYTLLEPFWVQLVQLEISHPDIPEAFHDFTIVFLSDIHCGPYFSQKRVAGIVDKTNKLKPNIVLLGGDYVHRDDPRYLFEFFSEMSRLDAEYGVYGVMGNHDYWMSETLTIQEMKKSNIRLLRNEGLWIEKDHERFFLGGVDDLMAGHPDIRTTVAETLDDDFTLLISHHPDVAEQQSTDGVDWMLSGHTHGGQVTLFGLWAPIIPSSYGQKYRTGLVQNGDTWVFVSNGVGTITPPVRFFARPQIIHITLRQEAQ